MKFIPMAHATALLSSSAVTERSFLKLSPHQGTGKPSLLQLSRLATIFNKNLASSPTVLLDAAKTFVH